MPLFINTLVASSGTVIDDMITDGTQIVLPEWSVMEMWEKITTGIGSFVSGAVTPVFELCASNEICLAFLSVTFAGLAVRMLRRTIGAFGRGR